VEKEFFHVVGVTAEGGPEGQSPYGNLLSRFGFKAESRNPSCSGFFLLFPLREIISLRQIGKGLFS
jgi:hypothetical protein